MRSISFCPFRKTTKPHPRIGRELNARGWREGQRETPSSENFLGTRIKSIKEYKKKYFEMGAAIYPQKTPRRPYARSDEASQPYCRERWIRLRRFNWAKLIGYSKARTRSRERERRRVRRIKKRERDRGGKEKKGKRKKPPVENSQIDFSFFSWSRSFLIPLRGFYNIIAFVIKTYHPWRDQLTFEFSF